jgi:hypothetical protein
MEAGQHSAGFRHGTSEAGPVMGPASADLRYAIGDADLR